jgi:thiol-disulfide isomerase/thioredoxin
LGAGVGNLKGLESSSNKKIGILINGDTQANHQNNINLAIRKMSEEFDSILVVSQNKKSTPAGSEIRYVDISSNQNIKQVLIDWAQAQAQDNPASKHLEYFIYTTGHGSGSNAISLQSTELTQADFLSFYQALPKDSQKTIIMDQCFSGSWFSEKENGLDENTLFYGLSLPKEPTYCVPFNQIFWGEERLSDFNNNSKKDITDRIMSAITNPGNQKYNPQVFKGRNYQDYDFTESEQKPFVDYWKYDPLQKKLNGLNLEAKPSYLYIGTEWCIPCKVFSPTLDRVIEKYSGAANFFKFHADNTAEAEEFSKNIYDIEHYPTLLKFENGQWQEVDRQKFLENYKTE